MNVEQLKKAKKEQHITYEQLSKTSGVPLSTIYDLFRGVTVAPRVDTVEAIERALGINSFKSTHTLSEQEREIISMYRKLPDKLKQLVIDQLVIFSTQRT